MANIKISELASADALDGTEFVPLVQNGQLKKASVEAIAELGGGGRITFYPVFLYDETGIGASNWQSTVPDQNTGRINLGRDGTYSAVEGEYVESNSTNLLRFRQDMKGSYYLMGIKCSVDSNFTPQNKNYWYQCSCILGQELGGTQRDYAIIIDKDGYFALGWDNATITSSTVPACDGDVHELFVLATGEKIALFIDGNKEIEIPIEMHGDQFWRAGVFYNSDSANTRVDGKIYAFGIWTPVYSVDGITLPTL